MTAFKYLRPESEEEAVTLLKQGMPGGGETWLASHRKQIPGVLDLNKLGLDQIKESEGVVYLGAAVRLQRLLEYTSSEALKRVLKLEMGWNLRNQATIAGVLSASDGRSPLALAILTLDAQLHIDPGDSTLSVDEFLSDREGAVKDRYITQLSYASPAQLLYAQVARAPRDRPIVSLALASRDQGDIQIGLGGYGDRPIRLHGAEKALQAGADLETVAEYARVAYQDAEDSWASGAYRSDVAAVLLLRMLREEK